jgi:hypothetical protein
MGRSLCADNFHHGDYIMGYKRFWRGAWLGLFFQRKVPKRQHTRHTRTNTVICLSKRKHIQGLVTL